jgi:CheY-like chemotaxis protein
LNDVSDLRQTVLIVEDEALIRLGLVADAQDAGFAVLEAASADQAIAILEARTDVSVVVTDIDMPGSMDGLRLAACVRDRWPPVKLILVSGQVTPEAGDLPSGGRFFAKPYRGSDIIAAIRSMTRS